MTGYIHSKESFGTVDGPGIRYVLFMQGCPLRCLYCHNPDTWEYSKNIPVTPQEVIAEFNKNRPFYKNGGITVTGGEPLMQIDFLIELFKLAKTEGIHTCIDTSGVTFSSENTDKFDELMCFTDLIMLDIKHIDSEKHKILTGIDNRNILKFAKYLEVKNVPVWIRHVVVPGFTDSPDDLKNLGKFIGTLKNLKALDILPYHTMGAHKYNELGINYPLKDLPALSQNDSIRAKKIIHEGIRQSRY